jgi:hypothetical protein
MKLLGFNYLAHATSHTRTHRCDLIAVASCQPGLDAQALLNTGPCMTHTLRLFIVLSVISKKKSRLEAKVYGATRSGVLKQYCDDRGVTRQAHKPRPSTGSSQWAGVQCEERHTHGQ